MNNRPAIPQELIRRVLIEAGHRCAIPTCKQTPVEIVHIDPWRKVREHVFDNLIALCPTCHTRFDKDEIDKKSMVQYKSNLTLLHSRYGDLEERVLRLFAENPQSKEIQLPGGLDILLINLLKDGFLRYTGKNSGVIMAGVPSFKVYELTKDGKDLIGKWVSAQKLE